MARVVLLLSVLTSLINCHPQFQQFSPPGRQFQQLGGFQGLPQQLGGLQGRSQQLGGLQGRPQQLGGFQGLPQQLGVLQGRPQQLGRLQARRVKFGDRTSRAQSLCTDFSNCQFGYTFNTAELDTDNGESVNTQFSVAALDQLPPLTTRLSSSTPNFGPQQNAQPPQNTRQPPQNTRQPLQPPQNTRQPLPPSPMRPEPPQNSLPAFPQFDLSSSKFDLSFPQFNFPSQPALSTNSIAHNPPRRIPHKPSSTTPKPTSPPRPRSTTPKPTPPPRPRSTTPTPTTFKPTTTTTTTTTEYEYEDINDTYYYDQYEESFSLHDDDVRDDSTNLYPIGNDDYEYDYSATTCPGSLEECINVCVPLEDIYVYSICVKECGDRCN